MGIELAEILTELRTQLMLYPEAHDRGADGERNKLLPADRVSHRRGLDSRVQRKVP